jgi:hypothetical protein
MVAFSQEGLLLAQFKGGEADFCQVAVTIMLMGYKGAIVA